MGRCGPRFIRGLLTGGRQHSMISSSEARGIGLRAVMAFEFGIFHEFARSAGQTDAETFAQSFAQVDAAERWGLDVVWLAELHFLPERSVASAPLVLASAIAARTRRLKIGIAVQVLPLCHPLRLAEEVATLDHVSGGRLIFGVGRSGFPRKIGRASCRERVEVAVVAVYV